jgi:nucleoside-diphosphate-sugar epimerase
MRVVLLGASGFVGSAILRQAGGHDVRALVRRRVNLPATVVVGALPDLPRHIFFEEPHVVLHFATRQRGGDFEDNARAMHALMLSLPPACRGVVYGSSLSVYGQGDQLGIDEDAPLAPATALARSRAECERILFAEARARHISAFALRPRFIIGRGDRATLPALRKFFARRVCPGNGLQQFGVIDVDDYASVTLDLACRALAGPPVQRALNVGYIRPVSLADLRRALGAPAPRVRVPLSLHGTRMLARIPGMSQLATQLELIGFSHYPDVRRLTKEIGDRITSKDPRSILDRAAQELV